MADQSKRYRVVQWATGNVGSRALRRVIEHPDYDLVGVWVNSESKVGLDAGDLAGTAPTGVKATNSIDDIIALKPDCVLYMPHVNRPDEVCRLLESGANVVTTRMEYHYPGWMAPDVRAKLEEACQHGNTSIYASGSSPGFISEAVPFALMSIQRKLERFEIHEYADCSSRNSPEMLFQMMGFGAEPGPTAQANLDHIKSSFGGSLSMTAEALGLPIDNFEVSGGQGVARKDVQIAAGTVPKGTVAATRTVLTGMRNGEPLMSFAAVWYVSTDVDTSDGKDWDFRDSGWRLLVKGDCPMDIGITFPCPEEDYPAMTPGLTAHRPVNSIAAVCEAPAGIRTTADLPQVIPKLEQGKIVFRP